MRSKLTSMLLCTAFTLSTLGVGISSASAEGELPSRQELLDRVESKSPDEIKGEVAGFKSNVESAESSVGALYEPVKNSSSGEGLSKKTCLKGKLQTLKGLKESVIFAGQVIDGQVVGKDELGVGHYYVVAAVASYKAREIQQDPYAGCNISLSTQDQQQLQTQSPDLPTIEVISPAGDVSLVNLDDMFSDIFDVTGLSGAQ